MHFAPEKILKEIFIDSDAHYYDCDIVPEKATHCIDITDIKFEANFFDYIVCSHVLEHISDDIKAMKELFRVLKPGGTAFLNVPLFKNLVEDPSVVTPEERLKKFGQSDHVRKYDFDTFCKRLKSVGFNIEKISYPELLPAGLKDSLISDKIFLAQKPLEIKFNIWDFFKRQ